MANGVCTTPGPNAAVLAFFQQYPLPNGATQGDGYNLLSYSFASPFPGSLNTTILKLDYALSEQAPPLCAWKPAEGHSGRRRGFPRDPPSSRLEDNSKGIAAGETWTITPHIVNDVRYGYIRQGYSNRGTGQGDYTTFRFINDSTTDPYYVTRTSIVNVPVNNIVDNLSWTKGSPHFGLRRQLAADPQQPRLRCELLQLRLDQSLLVCWAAPLTPRRFWGCSRSRVASKTPMRLPTATWSAESPNQTTISNYNVDQGRGDRHSVPDGTFINRHFKANEFEWYIQDAWRARPNLTITYGIRHTILQTPYEENGQQIAPTIDTDAWYKQRNAAALRGQVYEPLLQFAPSGPANHAPGLWSKQKTNFAPRLAIAYSPNEKTSIRAGFGLYFDHYGEGIVNTFDQYGSFGLNSSVETLRTCTPLKMLPALPASTTSLPMDPHNRIRLPILILIRFIGGFAIAWGADNKLKTPYAEAMDFSVQREIRGGLTLEFAYVGRLGRHLLQSLDLAEPVNYVDPLGGGDYFTNATKLSKLVDANGATRRHRCPPSLTLRTSFPNLRTPTTWGRVRPRRFTPMSGRLTAIRRERPALWPTWISHC